MSLERKLEGLESELKLVKGEIKQTLIDLREHLAQREAPFANLKVARLSAEAQAAARPANLQPEEAQAAPQSAPEPAARPQPHALSDTAAAPAPNAAPHAAPALAGGVTYAAPAAQVGGQGTPPPDSPSPEPGPATPNAPWRGAILALTANRRQQPAAPAPQPEAAAPPPPPAPEPAPAPAPVPAREPGQPDVHTVAGIIKWLAWAKDLLGSEGPDRLLELYNLTFRIPPATQEMIRAAQALVPDPPQPPVTASAEDSIALLLELHGILNGGGALMLLLHAMPQRGV